MASMLVEGFVDKVQVAFVDFKFRFGESEVIWIFECPADGDIKVRL